MNSSFSEDHRKPCTMTLTGTGDIATIPNLALIHLGVQTNGFDLLEIQAENARISQAILQSLRQLGVTEIKTSQYLIDKNYIYENGTRIDNGYNVRNIFEIRTEDLGKVGTIIDTAVASGANMVEFVTFEVSDRDYYYQQALNEAMGNAILKSKSLAQYLGLPMDPVPFRIVETSSPQPFPSQIRTLREGVSTPIEPGRYIIEASVTVEFRY